MNFSLVLLLLSQILLDKARSPCLNVWLCWILEHIMLAVQIRNTIITIMSHAKTFPLWVYPLLLFVFPRIPFLWKSFRKREFPSWQCIQLLRFLNRIEIKCITDSLHNNTKSMALWNSIDIVRWFWWSRFVSLYCVFRGIIYFFFLDLCFILL